MTRSAENPWLHRFALLTALATLGLIGMGGLVTSNGAGMAVPDWPTSYGYNMFLFPISLWQGGIFYEHSHRLWASGVGMLTAILAVWLWLKEERAWLRWLGVAAFFAVALQGVLGGLRVTLFKDQLGIFHATLAQLFLVMVCFIAAFTSARWPRFTEQAQSISVQAGLRRWMLAATLLVFLQLALGATMRHQHAGLAVPDFPLAYGKIWPPTDAASLELANNHRSDFRDFKLITASQIYLHMAHRITAVTIMLAVGACAWQARRELGKQSFITRFSFAWAGLIVVQAALGAWTVWSNKAADIATLHVVTGAASLVTGALLTLAIFRLSVLNTKTTVVSEISPARRETAVATGTLG